VTSFVVFDLVAWRLAHLPPVRVFTKTQERQINLPIFETRNSTYDDRRKLFPPAVADIIDTLQPYLRGNAFRDDPLWQLNELWTMDKHRTIPMSSHSLNIRFPMAGWERFIAAATNLHPYGIRKMIRKLFLTARALGYPEPRSRASGSDGVHLRFCIFSTVARAENRCLGTSAEMFVLR
jgi:hypothetical protein